MKVFKPLVSSAPAHSILNAQAFQYTNSVATDVRKTFARIRRDLASRHAATTGRKEVPAAAAHRVLALAAGH